MKGFLYAVLFSNGTVKIGRGRNAVERITIHRTRLALAGVDVTSTHVVACESAEGSERAALAKASSMPGVSKRGNEWFTGLSFEDACACIAFGIENPDNRNDDMDGIRAVLASNVRAFIGEQSVRSWAMSMGLDVRAVDRVVNKSHGVRLDTLEQIATACGVPAAALLMPFVPMQPISAKPSPAECAAAGSDVNTVTEAAK